MSDKPKPDTTEPKDAASVPSSDVMLVHGVSEDGKALAVLRARNNTLEAGVVRPLEEGAPVEGEIVKLTPRPTCPVLCDVEVSVPRGALNAPGSSEGARRKVAPGGEAQRRHGPAQVATATYRDNWDAIWSKPSREKLPN